MEMVITLKHLAKSICVISLFLAWGNAQAAMKLYHQTAAPATCVIGDAWIDTDGVASDRFHTCTATNTWTKNSGSFAIPVASASVSGTVKVGSRLTITEGVLSADVQSTDISGKQDTLVSGTNIKTINNTSLLGSGDLTIVGGSFDITADFSPTGTWDFTGANVTGIEGSLPTLTEGQTIVGGAGGVPTAVDTGAFAWSDVSGLITGTGYIKTDGTADAGPSSMVWPSVAGIPYWISGTSWAGAYTLDTDLSTTSASDDTIPSAKAVKSAIDGVTVAAPTVQSDNPTASSADGWYAATGSGDIFYKSPEGLFTIAGVYTADPVTYSLTITPVSFTGSDVFTYDTPRNTEQVITGLSADASFTVNPDTGREITCEGAGITDNTGGSYTANTDTANVVATCTSTAIVSQTPDYAWDLLDSAASTTILAQQGGVNGTLVNGGNTADIDTGAGLDLPSTGFVRAGVSTSIFLDGVYTVEGTFIYTEATGTTPYLLAESSGGNRMAVVLYASPDRLRVYVNAVDLGYTDVSSRNLRDGNPHVIRLVQNVAAVTLYEGASEAELTQVMASSSATVPSTWGSTTIIGGGGAAGTSWNGVIRNWKIWDSVVTP